MTLYPRVPIWIALECEFYILFFEKSLPWDRFQRKHIFSGSLCSPSFNFYILVCTILWIILWVSIGEGRGVYPPKFGWYYFPHSPPFEGDTCSVNLYIFPINFWIDNIPTNPLKVWDNLLWILKSKKPWYGRGQSFPFPLSPPLFHSVAALSRRSSSPPPTKHAHTFLTSYFWINIPRNLHNVSTRSLSFLISLSPLSFWLVSNVHSKLPWI